MSVVNKMLQDLEARQPQTQVISADYQPPEKGRRLLWLLLIICALLLMTAWFWFSQNNETLTLPDVGNMGQPLARQAQEPLSRGKVLVAKPMQTGTNTTLASPVSQINRDKPGAAKIDQPESSSGGELLALTPSPIESVIETNDLDPQIATAADGPIKNILMNPVTNSSAEQPMSELGQEATQQPEFSINDSNQAAKSAGARQAIINALNDGDMILAIDRLQQLLESEPENIPARKKLASLLFAEGRDKQASQILQQGLDRHPGRSDLRLMLARLYVQQKNSDEAIALLKDFQPPVDTQGDYWAYRAALAQQLGKYTLAKNDYLQLTLADPEKASWWLGLAIAQDRLGHREEALEAYRQANNKDQLSPAVVKFLRQRIAVIGGGL